MKYLLLLTTTSLLIASTTGPSPYRVREAHCKNGAITTLAAFDGASKASDFCTSKFSTVYKIIYTERIIQSPPAPITSNEYEQMGPSGTSPNPNFATQQAIKQGTVAN